MSRRGYSLFEVLVAFVILALVLAVLLPGQASLLRRAVSGPEAVLAQDYALSHLAHIGRDIPAAEGQDSEPYRDWTVQTAITAEQDLFHVVITISRGQQTLAEVDGWLPK
jgi:prepilin-type N-terminal cleavage/methylation domain-containing protein